MDDRFSEGCCLCVGRVKVNGVLVPGKSGKLADVSQGEGAFYASGLTLNDGGIDLLYLYP